MPSILLGRSTAGLMGTPAFSEKMEGRWPAEVNSSMASNSHLADGGKKIAFLKSDDSRVGYSLISAYQQSLVRWELSMQLLSP